MDAASTAFNKILHPGNRREDERSPGSAGGADQQTDSVDRETAPAVEHETIRKQHEQREQKVVDRERHQDHYKTTVQPLKEREVMPERHMHEEADVRHRYIDHDREHDAKVMLERKQAQFQDTKEEHEVRGETIKEPTVASERTHHHLHETIQPVIEKETVIPSVTHKKIPIKETVQDPTLDEGVTINEAMSKEEFEARMRK
ncbi:hypothetical protein F5Y14DRAFT_305170 [Nemania sp. NC0429]|nr:hypothetical protein F5Y14DRAFT_305170 [Nemania sp. NC0429]